MENLPQIFYYDKVDNKIKPRRGFENAVFELGVLNSTDLQNLINQSIANYMAGIVAEETAVTPEAEQHYGGVATLNSTGSQTITYASLGFPLHIVVAAPPRLIYWCERAFVLESWNNTSLTVRPSITPAGADTPFLLGVEVVGLANAIPDYVYNPTIAGIIMRDDHPFYPSFWDQESITLKAYGFGADDFPFTCGVFVSGRNGSTEAAIETWYIELELESESQSFDFEDANSGHVDSEVHVVNIEMNSASETKYFGALGITANISNARISGLTPQVARDAYISACTDTSFTINRFEIGEKDYPLRYKLEIRGG
jgi:hypothetical protein